MAKKPNIPTPDAKLRLPFAEAESLIDKQIQKGEELADTPEGWQQDALDEFEAEVQVWRGVSAEILRRMFTTSRFVDEFTYRGPSVTLLDATIPELWKDEKAELRQKITRLRSIKERLPYVESSPTVVANTTSGNARLASGRSTVFVVHGHHEESKQAVARTLEKLGLTPIILHEQSNRGKTVIEKLERHSDVAFAVVLLTPDDLGAAAHERNKLNPRARQNVVLELGYFIGRLGREKVAIVYVPGVELPSDMNGLLYTEYDSSGIWKFKLAKEMRDAGMDVDLNKLQ